MTNKLIQPNLQESEAFLTDLFQQVKMWESNLSGGETLGVGATTVERLLSTKIQFGNPTHNLTRLTPARFKQLGIELTPFIRQQMDERNFYYMTIGVDMRPEPGLQFKVLACELNFGPKGLNEPLIQTIFPQSRWRPVLSWGGGLSLALDGNLSWGVSVDASKLSQLLNLPDELKTSVTNKNDLKSLIVMPDYTYELGRFEIVAFGEGNSECYWYIDEPDLQKKATVQFGIIFKVPKETTSVELQGLVWTEPQMNWLVAQVENVFGHLSDQLKSLLGSKDKAANKFAQGAAEKWILPLPN